MNANIRYELEGLDKARSLLAIAQASVDRRQTNLHSSLVELVEADEISIYEAFNIWLWQCSGNFSGIVDCNWTESSPFQIMNDLFDWTGVEEDWTDVFDFISHDQYTDAELNDFAETKWRGLADFANEDEFKAELLAIMRTKTKGFRWRGHRD